MAWWGSTHFEKLKIFYWLTCLFLSIATVYCMFHYAVDVVGGLLLGVMVVLTFSLMDLKPYDEEIVRGACKE